MMHSDKLSRVAAVLATFGLATACSDPQSPKNPTPQASLLPWGGTIAVTNSTTGSSIGPGYEIWVDDAWSQSPPANGVSYFNGLADGHHKVSLIMMPANCLVTITVNGVDDGDNPRDVPITNETGATTYNVGCESVGSLVVGTNTTGVDLGPAGYTVAVDGASQPVATNGNVYFTGLTTGSHSILLSGVPGNCAVSGANPQSGTVTAGDMTSVTFSLSCAPIGSGSGSLTVTTSTTGSNLSSTGANLDAAGYTVTIDGTTSQPIATNGSVTFTAPAGDNPVTLSGMAANCTVSGANPQTVTVTAGGAPTTTFAVTCSPQPAPLEVRGHVQLGWGAATPGNSVQTFDFDVRADGTGRLTGTDWGDIHPSGPASITTDPVADPQTYFTAYRNASPSKCQDASRGVEFDGVGREPEGDLRSYTVQVCDDDVRRPAGNVVDFFSFYIPLGGYGRSGILTAGDIVKR
jgi:hypothetical protein